ncbi:MAG TPA: hypothetical protein DCE42_11025 [Myxococcales bacterium]|nr:hypothetical protein [Deltaproteobacteria bacterium]MBU54129.1 hypothetical protein [Deltaproteobacteria bacterium]HAA55280.1 hypothetical protein [Myxococcales bacterium]|tara:strand:- start:18237 stop:19454 length:1218 start_codon:yes stop_codon:yes gene_type:complete
MLSIEEARSKIQLQIKSPRPETVDILHASGRILMEDISAPWDFPRFDYSAMDGYALRAEDLQQASSTTPVQLQCVREIRASEWSGQIVQPGECVRIFTGAALPPGADAVVMQENTQRTDDTVTFERAVPTTNNVRKQGRDLQKDELLLKRGDTLQAGEIGLLASVGRSVVQVSRRPRVAILSCGDELMELYQHPLPGKILESNRFALHVQVKEAGGDPFLLPLVKDDPKQLQQALEQGLDADILLSSGGVSAGDYDLVRPMLEELGVTMHFWKVAIKPGKPLVFGSRGDTLIFGLPGNPISSMMTFDFFVKPAIRQFLGHTQLFPATLDAQLAQKGPTTQTRTHLVRGRLEQTTEGLQFTPLASQSSGNLLTMRRVNAVAILPPQKDDVPAGEFVKVLPFRPFYS